MDEEILIDKDNDIKYLERLVSQNTFLMILITIIVISGLLIFAYIFMDDSEIDNYSCSLTQMSTQEIEAFNSQFTIYEGRQKGAKLKSLIGTLISNANTYSDDFEKIPAIIVKDKNKIIYMASFIKVDNEDNENPVDFYVSNLAFLRNNLINKSDYYVEFEYTERGLVNKIIITGTISGLNERE